MHNSRLQGFFLEVRSHKGFELFVITIIISSALLVGVKTYDIDATTRTVIRLLDWLITLIFLVESSVRFLGEERKADFFRQG